MSGGVDIRPFPNNWKISEQLGPYSENPRLWDEHTVIEQLYRVVPFTDRNREVASKEARPVDYSLQPGQLAIVIDCGTEDYFFEVNRQLHERMLYRHISHEYIVRPGGHTHDYWREAVEYHMLFFRRFFAGARRRFSRGRATVIRGLRLSRRIVVLGVAADVGSGIGTDRPDPQVFGARVFEGGPGERARDPLPFQGRRNESMRQLDLFFVPAVFDDGCQSVFGSFEPLFFRIVRYHVSSVFTVSS